MKTLIYAVLGQIGAGKTSYAIELAKEKSAVVFSMDQNLAKLQLPIHSYADYERYYPGLNAIMKDLSRQMVRLGVPVVFDYGVNREKGRAALIQLAYSENVNLELHHLVVPRDERLRRVRERNVKRPLGIFSFEISDQEFEFISTVYSPPSLKENLQVVTVEWKPKPS